jgi:hypothetical protein
MVVVLLLGTFSWLYSSVADLSQDFDARMQEQAQMWKLQDEILRLEVLTTDSILQASRDSVGRRMLQGWPEFAQWSERSLRLASRAEIDMDWSVGDLVPLANLDIKASRFPVTMKIVPWSRSFEEVMSYMQKIATDSSVAWSLSEVIVEGSSEGVSNAQLVFNGWIRQ